MTISPLGRKGLAYATLGASQYVARRLLLESSNEALSSGTEIAYIIVSIALVIISGIAAGLTLGLLSIDRVDLEVIKRTGTDHQVWMANRVTPLLTNPHWLLTSLLLLNAAAYEALPIFLDRLLNPVAAILISVTAVLIFGEILPQAVCKRYGLQIGAYSSWVVRFVMIITAPISWPLGKCLDWLLGEETVLYRRAEMRELVTLHAEPDLDGGESMLTAEEVQVIHGALDMAHKTAESAMTPLANVFAISADAPLDRKLFERIIAAGHSRIPVYEGSEKKNITGLILVKELILIDQSRQLKVKDCLLRDVDFIVADTPLYSVMELFRLKRRHMAVLTRAVDGGASQQSSVHGSGALNDGGEQTPVVNENGIQTDATLKAAAAELAAGVDKSKTTTGPSHFDVVGVITIEDVIEELLNVEIVDETDVYIDNEQTRKVNTHTAKDLPPKLSKYLSLSKKAATKVPSAKPSPSKGQTAVVAAAAGAAYAAAKTQRRVQSEQRLTTVAGTDAEKKEGGNGSPESPRPATSML